MFTISNLLLIVATTFTALVAGLFWGWSVSVILGLRRVSDKEYVSFMQSVNRAIQNPLFLLVFLGNAILLPICAYFFYGETNRFWYLLAGTVCYLIGVFGVTMLGNVPLNNKLERFELDGATKEEITKQRKEYETPWANLNHLRAGFSVISIVLLIIACLRN